MQVHEEIYSKRKQNLLEELLRYSVPTTPPQFLSALNMNLLKNAHPPVHSRPHGHASVERKDSAPRTY